MANDRSTSALEKVVLEYPLNTTSLPMIWDSIATAAGLAAWFADDVKEEGRTFTFVWGRHEQRTAELINCRQGTYVRFHWLDEAPGTYFEMRVVKNALTSSYTLEVTDFAEPGESGDIKDLWDTSMDALYRCGI